MVQVVAAGMMLGQEVGGTAKVVKLFRVMLLMPVVLLIAVSYHNHPDAKTVDEEMPLVPGFLLAFIVLVLWVIIGVITPAMTQVGSDTACWLLVTAIAAAGIKTRFEDLLKSGWQPVAMLAGETLFIASLVLTAVIVLRLIIRQ